MNRLIPGAAASTRYSSSDTLRKTHKPHRRNAGSRLFSALRLFAVILAFTALARAGFIPNNEHQPHTSAVVVMGQGGSWFNLGY
ncbi:hypothetical protein ACQUQP_16240 [Marinobacterium sp. YM272]|uniref:hypothetical protein n=1 Tax=Marinobacterium sp. YM272 TaxID=3421654 RepID=UPI003D7FEB14